ncbi:ATPases of the AAA+ class [Trametopsis cervina]|nr:ATPases of the AAA+ class [Trametopsis cervina]
MMPGKANWIRMIALRETLSKIRDILTPTRHRAAKKQTATLAPRPSAAVFLSTIPNISTGHVSNRSSDSEPSTGDEDVDDASVCEPAESIPTKTPSPSEAEWQRQKDEDGTSNDGVDAIMAMIGLEGVKAQVLRIKAKIDISKRQGTSLQKERFNIALLGNSGTGKTTAAPLVAKFFMSAHVVPGNTFIETTGSRLENEGMHGIKQNVEQVLKAGGGVIFIDEAHQLIGYSNSREGQVLEFLLAEMEKNVGKVIFILAGCNKQMEKLFEHNPGLSTRVPYRLRFDDFSDDELRLMLERLILEKYAEKMKIEGGMRGLYMRIAVRRLGRGRGRDGFGNTKDLHNLLSVISARQAARLTQQRSKGKKPDDFLFVKEDLIGPDPSRALLESKAWIELNALTGLGAVKVSIRNLFNMIIVNYQRELNEKKPIQMSLNRVFLGNPGTGKTTVAKLYGQVLADLGLLTNGEVVIKNPADFIESVLGESEKKTKAILASTVGKVLVIDEAHTLYGGVSDGGGKKNDPYKDAVIDTIVAEVQSVPGDDRCVLLLGYQTQMREMFQNVNLGLSRCFSLEDALRFDDFSDTELLDILNQKLKQQDLDATDDAKRVAIEVLDRARNCLNFGNGSEVANILAIAKSNYHSRQAALLEAQRGLDIIFQPMDFDPNYDRWAHPEENLQKQFADLTGCEKIMERFLEWQNIARILKQKGQDPRRLVPTTFQFKGPPGTGKTTIARKMGQVYYDMGLLSSPEVIECSVSDLVADYVGQTRHKTRQLCEDALGKVLSIYEVYRLNESQFAKEALDELVRVLTQDPFARNLIVILAGYDRDMSQLMAINPGLSSRFPETITFENMSPQQCVDILKNTLEKSGIQCRALAEPLSGDYQRLVAIFEQLASLPSWGNAHDVITLSNQMAKIVYNRAPTLSNELILEGQDAVDCVADMLQERCSRAANLPRASMHIRPSLPFQHLGRPPPSPPAISSASSQSTFSTRPPSSEILPETASDIGDSERDTGVRDSVWAQL